MIRVMGIDPGSRTTGYGVVEMDGSHLTHVAHGAISSPAGAPAPQRLAVIYRGLCEVLADYAPEEVCVESIFHSRNSQTALKLGQARGVALLAAELRDLPVVEYAPMQVKSAVVGYGRAEKQQVQDMVRRLLRLPESIGTDAADALAVAICHVQTRSTAEAYLRRRVARQ